MYITIFQSRTKPDRTSLGFQYYKSLVPHVQNIPGFQGDAAFATPHEPLDGVNIARWSDADAVKQWRDESNHLRMQAKGADGVFESYRLRMGTVLKYGEPSGGRVDEPNTKHWVVLYYRPKTGKYNHEDSEIRIAELTSNSTLNKHMLDSEVYRGEQTVLITSWETNGAATEFAKQIQPMQGDEVLLVKVDRDYTKTHRNDAPHEIPGGVDGTDGETKL